MIGEIFSAIRRASSAVLKAVVADHRPNDMCQEIHVIQLFLPFPPFFDQFRHVVYDAASDTPHSAEHRPHKMVGVIAHDMSRLAGVHPRCNGRRLPGIQPTVRITDDQRLNAWLARRQESPEHAMDAPEVFLDPNIHATLSQFLCISAFTVRIYSQIPSRIYAAVKVSVSQRAFPIHGLIAPNGHRYQTHFLTFQQTAITSAII